MMYKKSFFRAISVKFKPGARKTLGEARIAVRVVYGFSSGFPDQSEDFPIVKDEIAEEDAPWDFR